MRFTMMSMTMSHSGDIGSSPVLRHLVIAIASSRQVDSAVIFTSATLRTCPAQCDNGLPQRGPSDVPHCEIQGVVQWNGKD